MTERIDLALLKVGESMIVSCVGGSEEMSRRLYDLGVSEGVTVRCLMSSPLGDPRAYLCRGAVIALRREDAATVQGELLASEEAADG